MFHSLARAVTASGAFGKDRANPQIDQAQVHRDRRTGLALPGILPCRSTSSANAALSPRSITLQQCLVTCFLRACSAPSIAVAQHNPPGPRGCFSVKALSTTILPTAGRLVHCFRWKVTLGTCRVLRYRFGNGGGSGRRRSLVRSSSRMTSIARLSWSSMPAYSRAGSLSTTMSGSTPCPSITQPLPSSS